MDVPRPGAGPAARLSALLLLLLVGPILLACRLPVGQAEDRCAAHPVPGSESAAGRLPRPVFVPVTNVPPPTHGGSPSYIRPVVIPDLETLTAASDLVLRGWALNAEAFCVEAVLINRLAVESTRIRLRLHQIPLGAPDLLFDPPLEPDVRYILFLQAQWYAHSVEATRKLGEFKPVGGAQGQWQVRGDIVIPLRDRFVPSRHAESVAAFTTAILNAADLREAAAALLRQHGWDPGPPTFVAVDYMVSEAALRQSQWWQARLAASQAVNLDFTRSAGKAGLVLIYTLVPDAARRRSVHATVYAVDGRLVGAFLTAGQHQLVLPLHERDAALAEVARR